MYLTTRSISRLKAKTKVCQIRVRDLLYADDTGLVSHTISDLQRMLDMFAAGSAGLSNNIGKTEVLYQAAHGMQYDELTIMLNGETLKSVKCFKFLGSTK